MITMRRSALLPLSLVAAFAGAQQKPATDVPATSTVSGRVFCADSNTPARMASVTILAAAAIDNYQPGEENKVSVRGEGSDTSLDGSFSIPHVAPGTYYVVATMPGYISPLDPVYIPAASDTATEKKPAPTAPRITVQAGLPVSVNVSIERGAAVSGTILYDDGSPATGVHVSLLVHWKDKWLPIPSNPYQGTSHMAATDDRGAWRISGLPAGKYMLRAELNLSRSSFNVDHGSTGMSMSPLYSMDFYSGGKTRTADATPFTLSAGEERPGEDLEIPVSKLHVVRGNILAARDGHIVNGGEVSLLYADDKSVAAHASVSHDDDTFTFSFVPEGDYILRVSGAQDNEYTEVANPPGSVPFTHTETKPLHYYGTSDQPLHLTADATGLTISVRDALQTRPAAKP